MKVVTGFPNVSDHCLWKQLSDARQVIRPEKITDYLKHVTRGSGVVVLRSSL